MKAKDKSYTLQQKQNSASYFVDNNLIFDMLYHIIPKLIYKNIRCELFVILNATYLTLVSRYMLGNKMRFSQGLLHLLLLYT